MSVLTRLAHAKARISQAHSFVEDAKSIILFAAAVKIIVPDLTTASVVTLALAGVGTLYCLGRALEKTEFQKLVQDFSVQKYNARAWEVNDLLKEIRDQNQVTLILKNPDGSAKKYSQMTVSAEVARFYLDSDIELKLKLKKIGMKLATRDVLPYETKEEEREKNVKTN